METETDIDLRGKCLNCGHSLSGAYCSKCGQKALPTKLPVSRVIGEVFETVFNVDNRLMKSLRELFFQPGKMTRNYNRGKRQRYVSPVRLYLSISLVYFILIQFVETDQIFL